MKATEPTYKHETRHVAVCAGCRRADTRRAVQAVGNFMTDLRIAAKPVIRGRADATDPARAVALRHLKIWRRDDPLPAVHECVPIYLVLR